MASGLVWLVELYLLIGILFAIPFVRVGVDRIDPAAGRSGWGFRLIIVPAVAALWPLLALRWAGATTPPAERNAHRDRARKGSP